MNLHETLFSNKTRTPKHVSSDLLSAVNLALARRPQGYTRLGRYRTLSCSPFLAAPCACEVTIAGLGYWTFMR